MPSFKVPQALEPIFAQTEPYVQGLFKDIRWRPEQGTIHVGDQRYVLVRCESLYLSWFDAMDRAFGAETAREFIYNTAREIGRSDSLDFARRMNVTSGVEKLAAGPIHFAHSGWAFVDILPDSAPATDASYFLHYYHPNTFEAETLAKQKRRSEACACHFSAGYSAGWCSAAFGVEVHGREIRCTAKGDEHCEFIMAPSAKLDAHEKRLK